MSIFEFIKNWKNRTVIDTGRSEEEELEAQKKKIRIEQYNKNTLAVRKLLDKEKRLKDDELKLDPILQNMSFSIEHIIRETSYIHGYGISIYDKDQRLRKKFLKYPSIKMDIDEFRPNIEGLMKVLAHANEILKVLVRDHKIADNKELQFYSVMESSYETYTNTLRNYVEIKNTELKISRDKYTPDVENIVEHIHTDKSNAEKREIIIKKLSDAFKDIKVTFEGIRVKDAIILDKYNKLLEQMKTNEQENKDLETIRNDIVEHINSILEEMVPRDKAINDNIKVVLVELNKISDVVLLDDNIIKELKDLEKDKKILEYQKYLEEDMQAQIASEIKRKLERKEHDERERVKAEKKRKVLEAA